MGREATCHAEWPGGSGEVGVHLETHEIIVRGERRERLALIGLSEVAAVGDALRFAAADGRYAFYLGRAAAASWARKIAEPPPTLAHKLGIAAGTRVHVVGAVGDTALQAAVDTGIQSAAGELTVAVIEDAAALDHAVAVASAGPLWLAYVKGAASPYGDTRVRAAMRERGWIDVKVASVSGCLTATKFVRSSVHAAGAPSRAPPCHPVPLPL